MTTLALIAEIYTAFNQRDVEGALALMSEKVVWPKASEGGRVVGKAEVRSYWLRQWSEFDPHVEPREVVEQGASQVDVTVHQVVKSLGGAVLFDGEVRHVFTIGNGLIERMDVGGSESGAEPGVSTAFDRH